MRKAQAMCFGVFLLLMSCTLGEKIAHEEETRNAFGRVVIIDGKVEDILSDDGVSIGSKVDIELAQLALDSKMIDNTQNWYTEVQGIILESRATHAHYYTIVDGMYLYTHSHQVSTKLPDGTLQIEVYQCEVYKMYYSCAFCGATTTRINHTFY